MSNATRRDQLIKEYSDWLREANLETSSKLKEFEDKLKALDAELNRSKWESRVGGIELYTAKKTSYKDYDLTKSKANLYAICLDCWLDIVGDWRPDWNDGNSLKFIPVWDGGLGDIDCHTNLYFASPFSFETKEQCKLFISRVGEQFKELMR